MKKKAARVEKKRPEDAITQTLRAHGLATRVQPFPIAAWLKENHVFAPPRQPAPPIPHADLPHAETALSICDQLRRLRDHALAGDADAVKWLGWVLSQGVADFGEIARSKPELVRVWSRGQNVVPVLTGKNAGHKTLLETDLAAFDVGAASPYKINPKAKRGGGTFNAETPTNRLAAALCDHLSHYQEGALFWAAPVPKWARLASELPRLSQKSVGKWSDAAWECLLSATDSKPEVYLNFGDCRRELEGIGAERQKIRQSLREALERMAQDDNTIIPSKT